MKMRFRSSRKAFTLIELMVVIVIIIAITMMAVGSYAGVQKQARLDFAADSLVSVIKEQLQFARSGARGNSNTSANDGLESNFAKLQCFALRFDASSVQSIQSGSSLYNAVGSEAEGQAGKVDFCDSVNESQWLNKDFLGEGLVLRAIRQKSLLLGGESQIISEPLELYFKPPFGRVYRKMADNFMPIQDQVFYFELGYKDASGSSAELSGTTTDSHSEARTIEYNVQSKTVRKI